MQTKGNNNNKTAKTNNPDERNHIINENMTNLTVADIKNIVHQENATSALEMRREMRALGDRLEKQIQTQKQETDRQIQAYKQETDRQIRERDARLERQARINKEENDRQIREQRQETNRQIREQRQETDRQIQIYKQEADRQIQEIKLDIRDIKQEQSKMYKWNIGLVLLTMSIMVAALSLVGMQVI